MQFEAKDGEATLWIYDPIGEMFGPDAVTAKGVRDRLASLRSIDRLTVRINSPGGEVDEAVAIHALLSEFKAEKVTKVDGIAASAATVIGVASDRIEMAKGSKWMIHNPWGIAVGDYREMLKAAEVAKQYRDSMVGMYSARTGKSDDDIRTAMDAETYMLDQEAVDWGFADSVGSDAAQASKQTGEQIMAQAVLVGRLAFAKLVSGTAEHVQSTMETMAHAAEKIAASRRERELALAGVRLNLNK